MLQQFYTNSNQTQLIQSLFSSNRVRSDGLWASIIVTCSVYCYQNWQGRIKSFIAQRYSWFCKKINRFNVPFQWMPSKSELLFTDSEIYVWLVLILYDSAVPLVHFWYMLTSISSILNFIAVDLFDSIRHSFVIGMLPSNFNRILIASNIHLLKADPASVE